MSAWVILSLPPVLWQTHWPDVELKPLDITIDEASTKSGHARGQTMWHLQHRDGLAAVGWEWVQIKRGFLALSDPMNIVSNLRIVDEDDCVVTDSMRMVVLNKLVHSTKWQGEIRRRLRDGSASVRPAGVALSPRAPLAIVA